MSRKLENTHVCQIGLGEDEADVANQHLQQSGPLLIPSPLAVQADGPLHHGVLAHQHHALPDVAQTLYISKTGNV